LFLGKHSNLGVSALGALALVGAVLLGGCSEKKNPATPETYKLTVKFEPAGSGFADLDPADYKNGDTVTVTVVPKNGKFTFTEWTGDASGAENPVTVVLNGNRTLTAMFLEKFTVTTVAEPVDGGTINRTPDSAYYAPNAGVVLRAIANPGYKFIGWDGDTTLNAETVLTCRMTRDFIYTAKFQQMPRVLIETTEGGSVSIVPEKEYYEKDDTVTLTATPKSDYLFTGWLDNKGNWLNSTNPYIITIGDTDVILTAEFKSF
jgi:uncharacterized repeat protein (TIGR02543 family)